MKVAGPLFVAVLGAVLATATARAQDTTGVAGVSAAGGATAAASLAGAGCGEHAASMSAAAGMVYFMEVPSIFATL